MKTAYKEKLHVWLNDFFGPSSYLELQSISGGQSNPTWFLTHGDRQMVLRAKPHGKLLKGAHAIEREYRVLNALKETDVPVPTTIHLEEDDSIIGVPFYLMERLEGRVFEDCGLAELSASERRAAYLSMARTLAKLHAVRPEAVGLETFGRPGDYFRRQISRWKGQYEASPAPRIPELDQLIALLEQKLPEDTGEVSIAHGDFRLGNMMFHKDKPEVIGVLDWELSTLGHPLADLGYCVMPWHSASNEYGGIIDLDWQQAGIPTEAEFVAEYYRHAIDTSAFTPFHIAFALFRFSVILLGVVDRAREGNANDARALDLEPLVKAFAVRALEAFEGAEGNRFSGLNAKDLAHQ